MIGIELTGQATLVTGVRAAIARLAPRRWRRGARVAGRHQSGRRRATAEQLKDGTPLPGLGDPRSVNDVLQNA